MQLPRLADPFWMVNTILLLWLVIMIRYFLFAGTFYLFFYKIYYSRWHSRKLNARNYDPHQFRKEVLWSVASSAIFAIAGAFLLLLWQNGQTKIYNLTSTYGWWYLPVSLAIFLVFHETYYYWLHRWMHQPRVFRLVHKIHHDSKIASPFTAFSFHPVEGILQAIFLPFFLVLVPMHIYMVLAVLMIMTVSSFINHLDIEIYPARFAVHPLGKWLIGATHHAMHHKQFRYNFGLYFTFWDKLKKTESPGFNNLFDKVTNKHTKP